MAVGGAEADLPEQLENLGLVENEEPKFLDDPRPGLYHGDEIKEMISETLKGWCDDDPKPKIYIVTPFIDEEGLQMIKDSIGDHGIEALYTRDSDNDGDLGDKMEEIFEEDDFVKLRVCPKEIEGQWQKLYYHCKFVAAEFEFPARVEILMTSANLGEKHFRYWQMDSVIKYEVTPEDFKTNYLQKLNEHSHDYVWPV